MVPICRDVDLSRLEKTNNEIPIAIDSSRLEKTNNEIPIAVDLSRLEKTNNEIPITVDLSRPPFSRICNLGGENISICNAMR